MTRLEKCELLKSKGYTYDAETGKIYGVRGKEIIRKNKNGYIIIAGSTHFKGHLYSHHFAWYMTYGNVNFKELDHINRDRNDNRISNLRIATRQLQNRNKNSNGYTWVECRKKWKSQIQIDGKNKYLGYFNSQEEASKVYLMEKQKI